MAGSTRSPNESFSEIATGLFSILRSRPASGLNPGLVIAVTSAMPGEGKSFIAEGLALHAAALSSYEVMLADVNPARPALTSRYQATRQAGVVDLLRGTEPETLPTELKNLRFLGIGRQPQPLAFLRDGATRTVLDWAGNRCDLLILDAGGLTDVGSAAMVSQAGRVLVVVDSGRTNRDDVRDAVARLALPDHVCAVVLNKRRGYVPSFLESRL